MGFASEQRMPPYSSSGSACPCLTCRLLARRRAVCAGVAPRGGQLAVVARLQDNTGPMRQQQKKQVSVFRANTRHSRGIGCFAESRSPLCRLTTST